MSYESLSASSDIGVANLFAKYFASNFEPSSLWNDDDSLSAIATKLNVGCLDFTDLDCHMAAERFNDSGKLDCDGLSPFILKNCINVLCEPLKMIFNKSLPLAYLRIDGNLPQFLLYSSLVTKTLFQIAKLSNVSKIFERIVAKQLIFLAGQIISPNQHGFMPGRSTTTNLATFNLFCIHSFISHHQVDVVYTHFAKAFDKVSHKALLAKLQKLGFHSSILNWLKSYLDGRIYRVECNGVFSSPYVATSGLPQGSALGPFLFITFINDLSYCITNSEFLLFADDLKIFRSVNSISDSELLQNDLEKVGN